jgi:transposase-like protein
MTTRRRGTVTRAAHSSRMRKDDVMCPACKAGFRRIEIVSQSGSAGDVRCPLCDALLEVVDGSTEVAYRLTVAPEKLLE